MTTFSNILFAITILTLVVFVLSAVLLKTDSKRYTKSLEQHKELNDYADELSEDIDRMQQTLNS